MRILVTGGAGFIGSALVRHLISGTRHEVLSLDLLTYAGTVEATRSVADDARYHFVHADICDPRAVSAVLADFRPDYVMHLAAESHVDRSIDGPAAFVRTNLVGTYTLLDEALAYWRRADPALRDRFRFHHVSTDEVFGELGAEGHFSEDTAYDPRSPYAASKAGADHLVSAWGHTYGLPVSLSNCSNNYGPYQIPEKFVPRMIIAALRGEALPVYGTGMNIRDWLFVDDHVRALRHMLEAGAPGLRYAVGGGMERRNIDVARAVCAMLDRLRPRADGRGYAEQIAFVQDRPGHDFRYAIDCSRIRRELGWSPVETFETGLEKTVRWYLENEAWWAPLADDQAMVRRGRGASG